MHNYSTSTVFMLSFRQIGSVVPEEFCRQIKFIVILIEREKIAYKMKKIVAKEKSI